MHPRSSMWAWWWFIITRASLFRFGIIKVLICLSASKKMLESEVSDRLSVNPKSVRVPTDLDRPIALRQLKEGDRDIQG